MFWLGRRVLLGRLALLAAGNGVPPGSSCAASSSTLAATTDLRITLPALEEGWRRLYLVRHGETEWNAEQRIQGSTDNPLNGRGLEQASLLASFLSESPLGLITSSPLARASLTADAVAAFHPAAVRVPPDARFEEMCFGQYEGRRLPEFRPEYDRITTEWAQGRVDLKWPGERGESAATVAERALAGFGALGLFEEGYARCPSHVLVAAHGRFNKIAIAALQGDLTRCNELSQGNTCINVIDIRPDGRGGYIARLVAANVRDHVGDAKVMS